MRHHTAATSPPDEGTSGLGIERITVRFGGAAAVDDVSLSVSEGEVVALLGPSGCGKSTLLRAVAGLQRADSGRVRWAGRDLAGVPVHRRGFGLMFQDGQLFVHRDVAGNIAFGLQMTGTPRAEARERTTQLLELVGLAGYEHRSVATLSGGEQQRVALARALAPHPRLLLLDEPLTGLDRALRERLTDDLAFILRHEGTTALHVTHDQDEAFAVADRVGVMSHGRLLQVDTPARLWAQPRSRLVAEFLGYEILPGVESLAGTSTGPTDGQPAALVAVAPGALRVVGSAVTRDSRGAAEPTRGDLVGVVVGRRARRGGTHLQVELTGSATPGPTVSAAEDAASAWQPGDVVRLRVVPGGAVRVPVGCGPRGARQ